MRRLALSLLTLWLALGAAAAAAGVIQHITRASQPAIQKQFAGRPFILTLWSLTCHHCVKELQTLAGSPAASAACRW